MISTYIRYYLGLNFSLILNLSVQCGGGGKRRGYRSNLGHLYTPDIYAEGYIVLSFRSYVCSSVLLSRS